MTGYRDGEQWEQAGMRYTVNSSNEVEGGYYLSQMDLQTGEKATAVYNADGSLADVKANQQWS